MLEKSSEGHALSDRLRHPWNQFLMNAQTAFGAEDLFYGERRFSSGERFALMPGFPIMPSFPDDSVSTAAAGGDGGGTGGSDGFARAFAWSHLTASSRLALEAEQNSQMASATYPRRAVAAGSRSPAALSFLGSDLPPLSLWRAGGELEQRGGVFRLGHGRGFLWSQSPLTGEPYALETQGTEIRAGVSEELGMRFRYYEFDGLSDLPGRAPQATQSEVALSVKGGEGGSWGWQFEWGYRKRVVERGSAWRPMNRASYPWAFRGGRDWKGDEIPWKIRARMGLEFDESVMLSRVVFEAEEPIKKNVLSQGFRVYHRRPLDDSAFLGESLPGDPAFAAGYRIPHNARGAAAQAGYAFRDSLWEAGWTAAASMEWETPEFEGVAVAPVGGADPFWSSRYGVYRGSDEVLGRGQGTVHAEAKTGPARLRALAGWQEFYGAGADAIEFAPAPYFGELGARVSLAAGLRGEARMQGMGPKRYRGYGLSLRVPPHWENHLGLEQSLFGERVLARVAVFHAFGEEIREHPLGNPLKFRITGGVTCKIR